MLDLLMRSCPDAASPQLEGAPMSSAAANGQHEAMQVLMQHGADINGSPGTPWSCASDQEPPFKQVVMWGDAETVAWMLQHGANATAALGVAGTREDPEIIRLLLQWGADVNAEGPYAMLAALRLCRVEVAHVLLAAGPPDYFTNDIGDCEVSMCLNHMKPDQAPALLQAALQHGHVGFATMLQQQGIRLPK
jgi:ankyrin repeat protein